MKAELRNFYEEVVFPKKTGYKYQRIRAKRSETQKELCRRLLLAKNFIDSSYHEVISLSDISQEACLASNYFLRQFKHFFGLTPHQYLMLKRLNRAGHLLLFTVKTVSEICSEVGYSDLSSFCKLFKSRFKVTPENFRKQQYHPKATVHYILYQRTVLN